MWSLLGGSSSTRLASMSVAKGTKRKREGSDADSKPKGEEVHQHMPQERRTPRPQPNPRSSLSSSNQLPSRSVSTLRVHSLYLLTTQHADHNFDVAKPSSAQNLLRLPAFIRNRILRDVLVDEEPYALQPDGRIKPKATRRYVEERENCWAPSSYVTRKPGILDVCKSIREPAHRIFYSGNSFKVRVSSFNANAMVPRWQRHAANLEAVSNQPITIAIASDEDGFYSDMSEEDGLSTRPELNASEPSLSYTSKALLYQKRHQVPTNLLAEGGFSFSIQTQYKPHWSNLKEWLQLFHANFLPALSMTCTDPTDQRLTHISAMFDSIAAYKDGNTWDTAEKCLEGHRKILIADNEVWSLPSGESQDHDPTKGNVEPSGSASSSTTTAGAMEHLALEGSQTLREESPAARPEFHRAVPFTKVSPLSDGDNFLKDREVEHQLLYSGPNVWETVTLSTTRKAETGNRHHQLLGSAYGSDFSGHQSQTSATLLGDETSSDDLLASISRSSRRKTTPVGHFEGMDPVPSPKELDMRSRRRGRLNMIGA